MVEKGITGKICQAIYWYVKANNKYVKDFDKDKESLYLKYWDVNNLHRWAIFQKLHLGIFNWLEETFQHHKIS